jgi:parallel beta-helix repeat protein
MSLTCCVVLLVLGASARAATFTVTNTNDSGPGSLRQAITSANATVAIDTIKFSIGSGAKKIKPLSALPIISNPVLIDGTSQPGYAGLPLIELDGSSAGAGVSGLRIGANGCTIKKLIINRFGFHGIQITGKTNKISGNYIGTDSTGAIDLGNLQNGVSIEGSASNNLIGGVFADETNVISGNSTNGIYIANGTSSNVVRKNFIGTNAAGTAALGNTSAGIRIISSPNNIIGESGFYSVGNVIAANSRGVTIEGFGSTGNKVESNVIGTNFAGASGLGNAQEGVAIYSPASGNKIGGTSALLRNVISGNGGGITISGSAGNKIEGNFIGVKPAGTAALGNAGSGIRVSGGLNNTIGGATAGAGNVISDNGSGIAISSATTTDIQGNFIGTDVTGAVKLSNAGIGVRVTDSAGIKIGGTVSGAGNIIAGSTRGVSIEGDQSANNVVQGNFIGTNSSGVAGLGNGEGIGISPDTSNTTVGGTTSAARNVISGNDSGLSINNSTGNKIQGNYIGTNPAGDTALGKGDIRIISATDNLIGGTAAGAGNVIAAGFRGISIEYGSTGTLVQGNFIGTNSNGATGLGNNQEGVLITTNSVNNTIGGTTAAARNVISGNGGGITISSANNNHIEGNFIGTNPSGTAALGNGDIRVISSSGNTIGGVAAGAGNIIASGFRGVSIEYGSTANFVQGNFIGTNSTGGVGLGHNQEGVLLSTNSSNNTIGGTTPAARNVISGNGGGVSITNAATSNKIQGNFIGLNPAGTARLSNTSIGVRIIGGFNNTVGGKVAGAGNVISGNFRGVTIEYPESTGNFVQGNYIGTDASGTVGLGNDQEGVSIYNAPDNTIGGGQALARNVISANKTGGITIFGASSTGNAVQGNYIGTQADGTSPLGNNSDGIFIVSAFNNTIGGVTAGAGNVIAFNHPYGVYIRSGTGNDIRVNSIFDNDTYGIDLEPYDITPNDPGDPDSGPNKYQNFPLLTSVTVSGNSTIIEGTLNSTPQTSVRLEFFSNPACDPSGFGEGKTYIGAKTVMTNASGDVSFTATLPLAITDQFVTATATHATKKNTSEFSPCALVGGANPGTFQFSADTYVAQESDGTITIKVTRSGGLTGTATVHYATSNGTATSPDDYTATSGTLTFNDGEVIKTFSIPIVLDALDENHQQTVNLKLTLPTGGATLGGQKTAKLFIIDYDTNLPSVFFSDVIITEGQSGVKNAVFTITMTPHDQTVLVGYGTSDGTAVAGTDYVAKTGTLTFQPGQLSKTVAVQIKGDAVLEDDEIFFLDLTSLPNATVTDGQGEGLIVNDD